ncbi:hypothetical protein M758_3G240400 [Ceratodon purpureus]|nr:hypothetical protein M758_3G240400 [Ceratodon purpureus]
MAIGPGKTWPEIKALNRIAIATEKKLLSILVDGASVRFCLLVRKSRKQAQTYQRLYQEPILLLQLVRQTAAVMQEFTQAGRVRPFGVTLLVAGFDNNGLQLYQAASVCNLEPLAYKFFTRVS